MVEVESFEPYHIGTKLQAHVDLGLLGSKLRDYLKDKQYTLPQRTLTEFPIQIAPASQVLGTKDDVRVWFNIPVLALNITGPNPDKVIQVFKEIKQGLSDLGYDLEATVVFYEILATIILKSEEHPMQKINQSVRISLDSMKDLGEVVVDSFRIVNIKPTEEQGTINLVVEPNPNNPDKSYSARLQFRCSRPERIEAFHSTLKEKVTNIMKSIEV